MQIFKQLFKGISGCINYLANKRYQECAVLTILTGVVIFMCLVFNPQTDDSDAAGKASALASKEADYSVDQDAWESAEAGMTGILENIQMIADYADSQNEISLEYSFEDLVVGQSTADTTQLNRTSALQGIREQTSSIQEYAINKIEEIRMSDKDYNTLLAIVEAEATGEGMEGKILVANVILNRTKDASFPDTVYDVVWEKNDGVPQFSPTTDGRIYSCEITDETIEAVSRAINGEDLSQGALYFVAPDMADPTELSWFVENLEFLFNYKVHDFYTEK